MKKRVLLILLTISTSLNANEAFVLDYDEFRAEGLTNNKEIFVIKGKTIRQETGVYLDTFSFSVGRTKFEMPKNLLQRLDSPYFALLRIANDSGINGNFYSISLPFGDTEPCDPDNESSLSYKELFIFYKNNGEIVESGIRKACETDNK